ncbi:MAG: 2-amino-5-chloromuconate deaminase CnbZ [Burkholderiales bacterium]
MSAVETFGSGGYRYIPAVFQYSSGVAAEAGFAIERARFIEPLPLAEAFIAVERHLGAIGRPLTAFAACELRSPEPFTEQGFRDFNKQYVLTLERWGIYRDGDKPVNPVARTNVCPMYDAPREPVMYAFSYTVPDAAGGRSTPTFVLAGGGEALGPGSSHRERIVRRGDTSPEGMRDKVIAVTQEMERRLELLGFSWRDATSTQAYTVQNIGHLVGEVLAARGACTGGLVWTYAWPPVIELEFEMDVRRVAREVLV